jgi:hypothetical protein
MYFQTNNVALSAHKHIAVGTLLQGTTVPGSTASNVR